MDDLDASSLLHILSHLDAPRDVLAAAATCRRLAAVGAATPLWAQRLAADFGLHLDDASVLRTGLQQQQQQQQQEHTNTDNSNSSSGTAAGGGSTSTSTSSAADLQATYAALACGVAASPPAAVRFAAALTDGGCDGATAGQLTYWADNALQPNAWSPHCSDGQADITIVGLLQPGGAAAGDDALSRRRAYIIDRCTAAAAVLFADPQGIAVRPEAAAASLATWSSQGLEHLFCDLYSDLLQQAQWGRLLLAGVPPARRPAEVARLHATAADIAAEAAGRHGRYGAVGPVPRAWLLSAAEAAAAAGGGGSAGGQAAGGGGGGGGAAAAAGGRDEAAAAAAVAEERLLVDGALLPWFSDPACTSSTALVREVVVSRVGHFTCPLGAGALLLGQHPGGISAGSNTNSSSSQAQAQPQAPPQASSSEAYEAGCHALLAVSKDPFVTALNGVTTWDALRAAVAAGRLPPLLHHEAGPGWEWAQFEPLPKDQLLARRKQGWFTAPLVWFRLHTPPGSGGVGGGPFGGAAFGGPNAPQQAHQQQAQQPEQQQDQQQQDQAAAGGGGGGGAAAAAGAHMAYGAEAAALLPLVEVGSPGSSEDWEEEEGWGQQQQQEEEEPDMMDAQEQQQEQQEQHHDPAAGAGGGAGPVQAPPAGEPLLQPFVLPLPPVQPPANQQQQAGDGIGNGTPAHAPAGTQQQQQQQQQHDTKAGSSSSRSTSSGGGGARPPLRVLPRPPPGAPGAPLPEADHAPADGTPPHLLLRMALRGAAPAHGNLAVLKLLSCENQMAAYGDASEAPNIDVQYVALRGWVVGGGGGGGEAEGGRGGLRLL